MNDTQQTADLTLVQQQVTAIATPDATMETISNHLSAIWDAADQRGDEQAKQYLTVVWENTQSLAQEIHSASAVAASALKSAIEMAEKAVSIKKAVENMDYSHPDVGAALEEIQDLAHAEGYQTGLDESGERVSEAFQDAYEAVYDEVTNGYNGEIYFAEPGSDVIANLQYEYQRGEMEGQHSQIEAICSEDNAEDLLKYLAGRTLTLTPKMAEVTAKLIRKWAEIYEQEMAAAKEAEQRARMEAQAKG